MGNTCLHYAVVAKDKDRVKLLLSAKKKSGKDGALWEQVPLTAKHLSWSKVVQEKVS